MNRKTVSRVALTMILFGGFLLFAPAAFAADGWGPILTDDGARKLGGAIGAALIIIGGASGIARVGSAAVEAMARQPEVAGEINTAKIITAAMIEGATLFAVVVGLLAVL